MNSGLFEPCCIDPLGDDSMSEVWTRYLIAWVVDLGICSRYVYRLPDDNGDDISSWQVCSLPTPSPVSWYMLHVSVQCTRCGVHHAQSIPPLW